MKPARSDMNSALDAAAKDKPMWPSRRIVSANLQTMRQVNRSVILNLIRENQPISCPQLAQLSGIHRSNVSLIADELIQEGLVQEWRAQPKGRGRVPWMLSLAKSSGVVLGVNMRLSRTTGVLADLDGQMREVFSFKTPKRPKAFIDVLCAQITRVLHSLPGLSKTLHQIALAVPGRVYPNTGLQMPDFPEYAGFPLAEELEKNIKMSVLIANGGNVAALAALWLEKKNGSSIRDLAFFAVNDSGVGGGIIFNGQLYSGYDQSFAGEFGHMIVDPDGPLCPCGRQGCLGEFVCDRATWRRYDSHRAFSTDEFTLLVKRARYGDPQARRALDKTIWYLLRGVSNIIMALNPQQITIAGEIAAAWDLIEMHIQRTKFVSDFSNKIRPARVSLNDLYQLGAVQCGLQQIFRAPDLGVVR
jgi:predicted NBD/HSP70 family sugar kinase